MLIEFSVTNFRSIRDKVTLSMVADKSVSKKNELPDNLIEVDKNLHLLKSAVIYGRNASGKSNLIEAFSSLIIFIRRSLDNKVGDRIYLYNPFRFDGKNRKIPTRFEISFLLFNPEENLKIKYDYKVEMNSDKIQYESLYFYPKGQRAKLFERVNGEEITYGESLKGNKKIIEEGLLENQLFLSKSSLYKIHNLNEVYNFFKKQLFAYDYTLDEENFRRRHRNHSLAELIQYPNWKSNILELLKAADTGINDIVLSENSKTILIKHEVSNVSAGIDIDSFLLLREESLGTQKLVDISMVIFGVLLLGGTMIIDELDRSLHPLLTKMLIQIFHSKKNNPNNAQLIFATHDSSLMNGELFRRDQMFITEKDEIGQTSIKSIASIKGVRKDIPFEKWYLNGSFGGIPVIYEPEFEYTDNKS